MFVSVALALLAASSGPASEATAASPSASPVKEKKICRKEEAVTGSLTPKRVCKTKAEWEGLTTAEGKASGDNKTPSRRD